MPVNSGSDGTQISFSDLQAAYGDPTPTPGDTSIPLSAFYRGSGVVPNTRTVTALASGSGSGNGDGSSAGISVDVQNADTTSTSIPSRESQAQRVNGGTSYVVNSNDVYIRYAVGGGDPDSGTTIRWNVNGGTTRTARDGNQSARVYFWGPRGSGASGANTFFGIPPTAHHGSVSTGNTINGLSGGSIQAFRATVTSQSRRRFVYTNNTGQTINLTTTSMGGNSNTTMLTPGASVTRGPFNGSNEAWTVSYPAVTSTSSDANNEIPTTGNPIDLDGFNTPGNFTP